MSVIPSKASGITIQPAIMIGVVIDSSSLWYTRLLGESVHVFMHQLMPILRIHLFRVYNLQHESDIIKIEAVETERRSRLVMQ